ncbi:uncharacterized protein LOC133714512 [Rosa rugosa]|uniref:uncharacterized protein LOC133714512 n=1 Tax=Rosa rugosa TaxID=74645 RepID=UPI002B415655|nr:uncharacterized protein LOC133714512 [Rosa rugosa]
MLIDLGFVTRFLTSVWISIMNAERVRFVMERGNDNVIDISNAEGSDDSDDDDIPRVQVECNHNADHVQPEKATIIEMEYEVERPLCMMCVHKYINMITKKFPEASQVTIYMGPGVPTVIEHRVPGMDFIGRKAPLAKHKFHPRRERAEVMDEGCMDNSGDEMVPEDEDGDGDEMDPEGGDGDEMAPVAGGGDEMDPEGGGGDEIAPEAGDGMNPEGGGGDEIAPEAGDGMNPEGGDGDEMAPEAGDGGGEEVDRVIVINRKRVRSEAMDNNGDEMDPQDELMDAE